VRRLILLGSVAVLIIAVVPAAPAAEQAAAPLVTSCFGLNANIIGDGGDNHLVGTAAADVIQGNGGDDIIEGKGGNDVLCGGEGADDISGGSGNDFIRGGPGGDDIRGNAGRDALAGLKGWDDIIGSKGRDVIIGGRGNDDGRGKSGPDYIEGNQGNDEARGGKNRDWCKAETEASCEGPAGPWRLKPTGIGSIPFGTATDIALVEFALLGDPMDEGDPDEDSGWVDSFSPWGTCPGDEVRMVRWGNVRTFFTRTGLTEGEFFFWDVISSGGYEDKKLATPQGLRLGHTRGQLELLYNQVDVEYIDVFDFWHFYTQGNQSGVTGTLEDGTMGAIITYLQGGVGCGE